MMHELLQVAPRRGEGHADAEEADLLDVVAEERLDPFVPGLPRALLEQLIEDPLRHVLE